VQNEGSVQIVDAQCHPYVTYFTDSRKADVAEKV
jgi:hypothetical protein